jgi:hypothetical protein
MEYPLDGLHFFIIAVFTIGTTYSPIAPRGIVRVILTGGVAVGFEESEGSQCVCPTCFILVEDGFELAQS